MNKDKDLLIKLLKMKRKPIDISSPDHILTRYIAYDLSLDECIDTVRDYFEGNISQDVLEELSKED